MKTFNNLLKNNKLKSNFVLHSMFLMNIMINKQELFEATRKLNILLNVVL